MQSLQIRIKHTTDLFAACILLVLTAPVLVLVALAIKLSDSGPVFFRQGRLGKDRRPFVIWKFRTMVVNADQLLDARGRVSDRKRVTRVGKLLRRLSLDEIPQLFNIICGTMSFVGPRPMVEAQARKLSRDQERRFVVRPGLTGLAQVHGRNTLRWSKRIEYDLRYVDRYSLFLDLVILARTIRTVLFQQGIVLDRNQDEVDDLAPAEQMPHEASREQKVA